MTRQTSIDVFNQIREEGLLSRMRWLVYSWLYDNGPATGRELNEGMGIPHAHVRLHELRNRQAVVELGNRKCRITGQTSIEWDVTGNLPVEPVEEEALHVKVYTIKVVVDLMLDHGIDEPALVKAIPGVVDYDISSRCRNATPKEALLMEGEHGKATD